MADKYYQVRTGILTGVRGNEGALQGRVMSAADFEDLGGESRVRQLVRNGALAELSAAEAEPLLKAQEAADNAAVGGVEDSFYQQTLLDEALRPERERMAQESAGAEPPPGEPISPRVVDRDRLEQLRQTATATRGGEETRAAQAGEISPEDAGVTEQTGKPGTDQGGRRNR